MTLTDAQRRALLVIYQCPDRRGIGAREFAQRRWIDHLDPDRQFYMSTPRRSGYNRKAGAFLEALHRKGLVDRDWPLYGFQFYYRVSTAGLTALAEEAA